MVLKEHNQEAYNVIAKHFLTHKKGCTLRATGTGKSFIITRLTMDYEHVLVIAPSLLIFDQISKAGAKADFCTYQSLIRHQHKEYDYDMIILDEMHRAGAKTWRKAVDRVISMYPHAKIFGCTATPVRPSDGKDMAQELFDGHVLAPLYLDNALGKVLPTPLYIKSVAEVDCDKIESIIVGSNRNESQKGVYLSELQEKRVEWESVFGMRNIIARHLSSAHKKGVVFFDSIESLNANIENCKYWFGYDDEQIFKISSQNRSAAKRELKAFEALEKPCVMLSVDMFNEGIHAKGVTYVVFLRRTRSHLIFLQQMGRCLDNDNTEVQPIVFDIVDNANNVDFLVADKSISHSDKKEYGYKDGSKDDDTTGIYSSRLRNLQLVDEVSEIRDFIMRVRFIFGDSMRLPFEVRKQMCIDYVNKYKKLPSVRGKYSVLYTTFLKHREDKELNAIYEQYRCAKPEEKIKMVKDFCKKHNRLPGARDGKMAHALYFFVIDNKQNIPELQSLYEQYRKDPKVGEEKKMLQLIDYIRKNKRLPHDNRMLYSFYYRKGRYDTRVIELVKPMRIVKPLSRQECEQSIIDYYKEHGELPRQNTDKKLWQRMKNLRNNGSEVIANLINTL